MTIDLSFKLVNDDTKSHAMTSKDNLPGCSCTRKCTGEVQDCPSPHTSGSGCSPPPSKCWVHPRFPLLVLVSKIELIKLTLFTN